ncbi:MAG: hypothetical protein OER96_08865 [Gammaproteobacteria bacterium]|nr:hypothetical protein [Gammaproteobacteria bacterium]
MLAFYTRLGKRLHRIRYLLWVILVVSMAGFGVLLLSVNDKHNETLLTLSLLTALWSLCALGIQMTFVDVVPAVESGDGFFIRLKKRFVLATRWILAIAVTGVTVAVLITSFRVISALS